MFHSSCSLTDFYRRTERRGWEKGEGTIYAERTMNDYWVLHCRTTVCMCLSVNVSVSLSVCVRERARALDYLNDEVIIWANSILHE